MWVKAFHIIAMVAWMASLLVYPRYKMNQTKSRPGEPLFDTMMESADLLKRTIMTPAMVVTWTLGFALTILNSSVFDMKFIWVKLLLVIGVTVLHVYFIKIGRALDEGHRSVSVKLFSTLNEVPFVVLILVVILVVVKPF